MDNEFSVLNSSIIESDHLSYQQKYYIITKEKIKKYQKEYYQNKKSTSKNFEFSIIFKKVTLFGD